MQQWRVSDVMTREVVTLPDHALTAEVAALLSARGISGVPIVDGREVVVGVVTWTDILRRIDFGRPTGGTDDRQLTWDAAGRTAADLMDAMPATITPEASLTAAGREMQLRNVSRLLVVDPHHRLLGIVTRRDLLKPLARMDAAIEGDVTRVLRDNLTLTPETIQVRVEEGVATVSGRTRLRTTALAAVAVTGSVLGVAAVIDQLSFDMDDTGPAEPSAEPSESPKGGWNHSSQTTGGP
jgi:CBS domain-containing protein